jgi:hypothetical protein
MNFDNLSIGQIIQVFLTIGGYVKGEFAGVTNDTLLMNNCIAKRSRCYKVDKGFIPFKYIKKLEVQK